MVRYPDNSPIGNTCPMIDEVVSFLDTIDIEFITLKDIRKMIDKLEEIRNANRILREWGNELYYEKELLQNQYDEMIKENEMLKSEIIRMEVIIRELEEKIEP